MAVYTAVTRSRLLSSRLARFERTLAGIQRREPEALHRARVASRRLRELLPLLPSAKARKLRRRLGKVTAGLSAVRELDAMLPIIDERLPAPGAETLLLDHLRDAVMSARDEARTHLDERLTAGGLRRLTRKLGRLADEVARAEESNAAEPRGRGWRWALDARIARRGAQLARAIRGAGAVYLPERLHDVRIAVKKLRYAMELAGEAGRRAVGAELRLLKRSQDVLGRMHDLERLLDRARTAQASLTPDQLSLSPALDGLVASFEDECRRLHARYVRASGGLAALTEKLIARQTGPARGRTGVGHLPARRARVG